MDCRFCNLAAEHPERIICETKNIFVTPSNPCLMFGHVLVIPKRHVERLSELTKEERDELIDETIRLQEKVLKSVAPGCDIAEHFRPFIPDNRFKVAHLHIHVRPRSLDDALYEKVQIYEKDIFQDIKPEEYETYRKLFAD